MLRLQVAPGALLRKLCAGDDLPDHLDSLVPAAALRARPGAPGQAAGSHQTSLLPHVARHL